MKQEWIDLLGQAELAYRDAAAHAEKYRRLRNETIRSAAVGGLSHTEIARVTELSRSRVGQIVEGDD